MQRVPAALVLPLLLARVDGTSVEASAPPPGSPIAPFLGEDDCHRGDVQKVLVSAAAGALLALAIVGRPRRRDANTWTKKVDAPAQTQEELSLPLSLVLPPTVEYLPMPLPMPLPPPPPELVYDMLPKPPTATAACQTMNRGVSSTCQTDWHGAPSVCHRRTQTIPEVQRFPAASQTLAVPALHAFSQTELASTQTDVSKHAASKTDVAIQPTTPAPNADDRGSRGGSSGGGSFGGSGDRDSSDGSVSAAAVLRPATAVARTQTDAAGGSLSTGMQTNTLHVAVAFTQTETQSALITTGTNTIDHETWSRMEASRQRALRARRRAFEDD